MGFVSFLSLTANGFCRVKIREIFPIFGLQTTLTYFASTFVNITLCGTALPLISRILGFSRCKTFFGNIFTSALQPFAEKDFDVCVSPSRDALPHWNTAHPRALESFAKPIHSAF